MGYTPLCDKDASILLDYQAGLSWRAIFRKHSCSKNYLMRVLEITRLSPTKPDSKGVDPKNYPSAIEAYKAGAQITAIAKTFQTNVAYLYAELKAANIPLRRTYRRTAPRKIDQESSRTSRHNHLRDNYKISLEQYETMFAEQKGLCAICGKPESSVFHKTGLPKPLCVDHDHATGKIRKLLCHRCNAGLGYFGESPEIMTAAIQYLNQF